MLEAYVAQLVRARKEAAARAAQAAAIAADGNAAGQPSPALFVNDDPLDAFESVGRARHSHFSHRGATLSPGQFQVRCQSRVPYARDPNARLNRWGAWRGWRARVRFAASQVVVQNGRGACPNRRRCWQQRTVCRQVGQGPATTRVHPYFGICTATSVREHV